MGLVAKNKYTLIIHYVNKLYLFTFLGDIVSGDFRIFNFFSSGILHARFILTSF